MVCCGEYQKLMLLMQPEEREMCGGSVCDEVVGSGVGVANLPAFCCP